MKRFILSAAFAVGALCALASATPSYPGGDAALQTYLKENLKYPQAAIDNGIEGVVDVAFTVKADGSIGAIKIVRMVDPDPEQEAIRLVKNMPKWTPADGAAGPVDAPATVKVTFTLPE